MPAQKVRSVECDVEVSDTPNARYGSLTARLDALHMVGGVVFLFLRFGGLVSFVRLAPPLRAIQFRIRHQQ